MSWTCPTCKQADLDDYADLCPNNHLRITALYAAAQSESMSDAPAVDESVKQAAAEGLSRIALEIDGVGFVLNGSSLIGRHSRLEVLAQFLAERYPNVSRRHVTVTPYTTYITVVDYSLNGTFRADGTRLPMKLPQDFTVPVQLRLARNCYVSLDLVPGTGSPGHGGGQ